MRALALSMLLAFAGFAAAQTPAPAPTQEPQSRDAAPPAPKKPLNLSLDPSDAGHSRITFDPREDKKPPTEATLPGMGGERTRSWEAPSDKVFPPDTNPNSR